MMEGNELERPEVELIREDYQPAVQPYPVQAPEIKTGSEYYFETVSGLTYQVMFARKTDNYLENVVNFSVLSEDYEDEYSETNRGEIYRVIATVIEVIRMFHQYHAHSIRYEFSGEFKKGNEHRETSIRTLLYYRKAREILNSGWKLEMEGNRVIISLERKRNPF
jgi:hypothetical protein